MKSISSKEQPGKNAWFSSVIPIGKAASFLVIAIVIFSFYAFVVRYAVNVPYFDDLAYLEYILKFRETSDFFSFAGQFLDKHNGHGVLTAKLVFWIDYLVEGQVNYRTLIIAGSGLVLIIFGYLFWLFGKNGLSLSLTLPIALFLFNPSYHENIFWAASSWQYTASFVTAIVMFVLLARSGNTSFVLAIAFGFITTYTNGNGLVGFLIGIIIPVLQERYWRAGIWLLAVIATGFIFYWYYPYGMGSEKGRELKTFLVTLISFTGAAARYLRAAKLDVAVLGIILTLILSVSLVRIGLDYLRQFNLRFTSGKVLDVFKNNSVNLSLLGLTVWLFVTGLGTAWTRGAEDFSTALRFMIYSVMIIVAIYSFLMLVLPDRFHGVLLAIGVVTGLVFQFGSYMYAGPEVITFRNSLWADVYNLKNNGRVSGKVETMNNTVVAGHFQECLLRGIYVYPKTPLPDTQAKLEQIADPTLRDTKFMIGRDTLMSYFGILITSIKNDKILLDQSNSENSIYVALKELKTGKIYLTAADPTANNNRKMFLKTRNHFNEGIEGSFYAENIKPGWYQIGLLSIENAGTSLYFTNQEVEIIKIEPILSIE